MPTTDQIARADQEYEAYFSLVEQAMRDIGLKPIRISWEEAQKGKKEQRQRDWDRIASGEATPEEIQRKNSCIPSGVKPRIVSYCQALT